MPLDHTVLDRLTNRLVAYAQATGRLHGLCTLNLGGYPLKRANEIMAELDAELERLKADGAK